jgi:hypothetical protein
VEVVSLGGDLLLFQGMAGGSGGAAGAACTPACKADPVCVINNCQAGKNAVGGFGDRTLFKTFWFRQKDL